MLLHVLASILLSHEHWLLLFYFVHFPPRPPQIRTTILERLKYLHPPGLAFHERPPDTLSWDFIAAQKGCPARVPVGSRALRSGGQEPRGTAVDTEPVGRGGGGDSGGVVSRRSTRGGGSGAIEPMDIRA